MEELSCTLDVEMYVEMYELFFRWRAKSCEATKMDACLISQWLYIMYIAKLHRINTLSYLFIIMI